jgi:hypothetical protein
MIDPVDRSDGVRRETPRLRRDSLAAGQNPFRKSPRKTGGFFETGGMDGTRTRGLLRDRQTL